jgi:hypothetical protein
MDSRSKNAGQMQEMGKTELSRLSRMLSVSLAPLPFSIFLLCQFKVRALLTEGTLSI